LLFIYRIGLHQVTPLGVVFLFMLVNWWVEKHERFLFNVYKRFFIFVTFFTFFNVFLFFWNVFYIYDFRRLEILVLPSISETSLSYLMM